MELVQLRGTDQTEFAEIPEIKMDLRLGRTSNNAFYLVVGCRVGVLLNESRFTDPQSGYLSESWLRPSITADEREAAFEEWPNGLPAAPPECAQTQRLRNCLF